MQTFRPLKTQTSIETSVATSSQPIEYTELVPDFDNPTLQSIGSERPISDWSPNTLHSEVQEEKFHSKPFFNRLIGRVAHRLSFSKTFQGNVIDDLNDLKEQLEEKQSPPEYLFYRTNLNPYLQTHHHLSSSSHRLPYIPSLTV